MVVYLVFVVVFGVVHCTDYSDIFKLEVDFGIMVDEIKEAFKENNVDVSSLLTNLRVCKAVEYRDIPVFADNIFHEVESIDRLFEILSGYWFLFDYCILDYLVSVANCQAAKSIYEDFLAGFDCAAVVPPVILEVKQLPKSSCILWIKVSEHKRTSAVLQEVKELICRIYGLQKFALIVRGIKEGCIELVCQMPALVKPYVLHYKFTVDDILDLKAHKITAIKLDDDAELIIPLEINKKVNINNWI